jgi:hypothetical protein
LTKAGATSLAETGGPRIANAFSLMPDPQSTLSLEGAIMRPLFLALPASLLLLASTAGAQTVHYPLTEPAPESTVQVPAPPAAFYPWTDELEAVSGKYAMSNGWRLQVEPASQGIVARIDKQHPVRLVALSPNKFVSRDGNVAMEFNRGEAGDQMLMSYVPDPRVAEVIVVTATLAQR